MVSGRSPEVGQDRASPGQAQAQLSNVAGPTLAGPPRPWAQSNCLPGGMSLEVMGWGGEGGERQTDTDRKTDTVRDAETRTATETKDGDKEIVTEIKTDTETNR